ncbi:MAG: amidohydrolase [Oricola sp.]
MTPDTILLNADIHTMDFGRPRARAMAFGNGRILALGSSDDMRSLAGPNTRVIDAGGRMVLPAFQDAHVHLMDGGTDLAISAQLYAVETIPELQDVLGRHAAKFRGSLMMGAGWQAGLFGDHNLTREVLDAAVHDRPCIVFDSSFHNACINSAACAMAGIEPGIADPHNGHFVVDAAGRPTGMLHEEAIYWTRDRLPEIDEASYTEGARAGQAHANRHGITGIIDPNVQHRQVAAYSALDKAGEMTLRVSGAALVTANDTAKTVVERLTQLRHDYAGPRFWVNSAKFFLDGVLENRTAAMIEPYADAAGGNAPLMFEPGLIRELFTALDAERFQIHSHVIGDMAVRATLDGLEAAMDANGRWPSLHQLAHVQVIDPSDLPRFAQLGAMANIQTLWARFDPVVPDLWIEMIGPKRGPLSYAFRSMLNAGAPYCISSDFPVTTLNPFEIMETAVTRQAMLQDGAGEPFYPAECLTIGEALAGYTCHAADACWRGQFTGRLRPGFSADAIVIDRDVLACPPHEISQTQVLLTLFEGREVWRDEHFDG